MKKPQYLSVHDYQSGAVVIRELPEHLDGADGEVMEYYLFNTLNYSQSMIEWMICDDIINLHEEGEQR